MRMRILCLISAWCISVIFGSTRAQAQALEPDAFVHSVGGWYLVEVKDTLGSVIGFWGIPRVPVAVGNIRRLWFEAIPNNDWNVWAFEPVAIHDKVGELILAGASSSSLQFLMYQELLAADTAVNLDIDGGVQGLVLKGFIAGDPLAEAAGSLADPNPMIDLLAGVGYPIAPGMTDLLVDGTAGASVGMNQATKQTLNCLRSATAFCGECVCVKAEAPRTFTPWVVVEQWVDYNTRLRCTYSRTETHWYWQWGEYPEDCLICTAGSADSPISYEIDVEFIEYWFDQEHCPDEPLFSF